MISYSPVVRQIDKNMSDRPVNRLAGETSPYLVQHADNPVDWYPWGPEALALAQREGKPVLLSIGYSACHWCHVMAHESFEDDTTASLMNEHFVNIKVDREERPDIDKIYQTAHQLLTQRAGGWPLTMFISPDTQRPFFGGTYFPKVARYGMPSFTELITRVAEYYRDHKDEVESQGRQLIEIFGRLEPGGSEAALVLNHRPLRAARDGILQTSDWEYGGIGNAPKFPHPSTIDRLLRHWRSGEDEADEEVLAMVSLTMMRMAEGGIYDQLGGGFCRYTVDRHWQIPHFEKMLYDNGPLLALYAQAWLATGEEMYRRIASETAGWMLADMRAPNGGFYSSRDADSEGEEGRYYVWTPAEVNSVQSDAEFGIFARRFGLDADANFEGKWHLSVRKTEKAIAEDLGMTVDAVNALLDTARQKLLQVRHGRVPPGRDEKQLTSWNALAIRGLAIAGPALGRSDLVAAARESADFLRDHLLADGRLLASYKDERARFPAYLDDHAFLLDALLELLQADWHTRHIDFAVELAELLLRHFSDEENGGFYFTADDHENLMHRPKPLADEAVPSGNGIAAFALQRLGFLLGETRYLDAAEKTLRNAWRAMDEFPHGHVSLLNALDEYLSHPEIIIIRGQDDEIRKWRDEIAKIYAPRRLVYAIGADAAGLPGSLADRKAVAGKTVAYRCVGSQCSLPLTSLDELMDELSTGDKRH